MRKLFLTSLVLALLMLPVKMAFVAPSIGEKAPEVELPDMNGNTLKLSSLKGKLVLLNFWSTWCVACNKVKNPEYVRLWNKYKSATFDNAEEFTLYSVAFDSDKNKWLRRIAEQELSWPNHVVDQDSYYSLYWWVYNIRSIPSSFLLDENGKIIGVNMTYDKLDRELAKRKRGEKSDTPPVVVVPPDEPPVVVTPPDEPPPVVVIPPDDETKTEPAPPVIIPDEPQPPVPPVVVIPDEPEPPAPPVVEVEGSDVYKIQLGVFRTPDLNKFSNLNDLGTLEIEQATTRLKRVLLGSYATRSQANQTLVVAKNRGYRDAFVRKAKGKSAPPPPPASDPVVVGVDTDEGTSKSSVLRTVYKIQLGAFGKVDLSKFGILAHIGQLVTEDAPNGLKRVHLGRFDKKSDALAALPEVKQKGFKGAFIVSREEIEMQTASYMPTSATEYSAPASSGSQMELMALNYGALKSSMIGKKAPEISLKNSKKEIISLSDNYRNPITVVYFWASWSGEARRNHTDLNKLWNVYKDSGLGFYSVAFDKKANRWEAVSKEDDIRWDNQMIDTGGTESDLLRKYKVEYLPALFLVDKNGKVIAENLSYEQLDVELKRRLGK